MSQMWVPAAVITAVAEGEVAVLTVAVLLPPAPPTSLHDDFTPPGLCRTAPAVALPAATAISFWSFPNTSWYASNWLMSSTFTLKKEEKEYRLHRIHTVTYPSYYDKNIMREYKDAGNKWTKWWWLDQPAACFILMYRLCINNLEKIYLQKQPFSGHSVINRGGISRVYTQGGKWTVKNDKSFSEDTGRKLLHQDKATIHPWREPTSSFPLRNG